MLGEALKGRRQDAVVASKVFNPVVGDPTIRHVALLKPSRSRTACAACRPTVGVYYIHHVGVQTPLEEMLRAFDDLVRRGKILYTACSNYETWRDGGAVAQRHKQLGALRRLPAAIQLVVRDIDEEIVPAAGQGVGPAWSPLAGGYLAGSKPGSLKADGTRRPKAGLTASSRPTMPIFCRRFWTPRARSTASPARARCAGWISPTSPAPS